ncbi:hypothetical protein [Aurantibacillus circumpalustris]|uniref:hypothetical protein n=1 Tax=Aurantibacillus circumpalustris TaxID=3036359 RepID=UPI00295B8EB7|nr:hypothetical protein [Aurantibacillus circumpalustris]
MKKIIYFVLLFALTLVSCKKEGDEPKVELNATIPVDPIIVYDTIKPSSYFPAYPGSYWTYTDDKNQSFTSSISPTYQKDAYSNYDINRAPPLLISTVDSVYVPFSNGYPIWGYKLHTGTGYSKFDPVFTQFLSENLGAAWTVKDGNHDRTYEHVIAKDTTIIINGHSYYPTLVIFGYIYHDNSPAITYLYRTYYTKDVGQIKYERLTGYGTSYAGNGVAVTATSELTSYFINK